MNTHKEVLEAEALSLFFEALGVSLREAEDVPPFTTRRLVDLVRTYIIDNCAAIPNATSQEIGAMVEKQMALLALLQARISGAPADCSSMATSERHHDSGRIAKLIGDPDKYRWIFRVILGIVVGGSIVVAVSADLAHEVQVPLFAVIAATGWAGTLGTRTDRTRERTLKWLVRLAAIGASGYSAIQWLLSAEAGPGIQLWGAVLAAFALGIIYNLTR